MATAALADISPIASFPPHFFLGDAPVRADGSILVTVLSPEQLWLCPRPRWQPTIAPVLVHTSMVLRDQGVVETEPDIFYVGTVNQPPRAIRCAAGYPGARRSRRGS